MARQRASCSSVTMQRGYERVDIQAEYALLLNRLIAGVGPGHRVAPPTPDLPLKSYGLPTAESRGLAKAWRDAHKDAPDADWLGLVDALWAGDSMDERHLALELLNAYPRRLPTLPWEHFDRWRPGLVDWSTTDHLGYLLGPWLLADLAGRTPHLDTLIAAPDLWSRRLALVGALIASREDGALIPDRLFSLLDRVQAEREPLMVKAVSWALRELSKHHPDRVAAYVDQRRSTLPALVIREVNHKLRTGLKSGRPKR
ncbi:MAG: DNA alkylation repair protein [Anaerolineae bacterium]|nr:DNA alkylation repair protein [Anaerolineae bacterium]